MSESKCVGIDLGSAAIVAGQLLPSGAVDILVTATGGRYTAPAGEKHALERED